MKIRHPALIRTASLVGATVLKVWTDTTRLRYRNLGPDLRPDSSTLNGEKCIYAFWHGQMLGLLHFRRCRTPVRVLISEHADGELITQIIENVGWGAIRGSSTRGGARAMFEMIRSADACHLAVTPDGPRGPYRVVQQGIAFLAARTDRPVIPAGVAFTQRWQFNSWDRFEVPRPMTDVFIVTGEPLRAPAGLRASELEPFRLSVQHEMDRLNRLAAEFAGIVAEPIDPEILSIQSPRTHQHAA